MNVEDRDTPAHMSRRDELEALLPFYLNGTLDGADLASIEEWLATDPNAAAALAEAELEYSGTATANEAIRPPSDALSRFAKALDAEAGADRAATQSVLARLWDGFWAIPARVAWAAAAAAIALVLVQTVMEPGGRGPVEIAGAERDELPFALVTFRPDARMADVAEFLSEHGAGIISGPAAGGVFRVGFPAATAEEYDRIVGLIAAQPFANTVLAGRKPDNGG